MIFPADYRVIGVKDDDRYGGPIYFSTEYIISHQGPKLFKAKTKGKNAQGFFLRDVDSLELIASGREILEYPEKIDTRDRARLIELAYAACQDSGEVNTVLFQGPDEHVTFVHRPDLGAILTMEVLDVVPPYPSWLSHVLEKLKSSGVLGDLCLKFKVSVMDLREFDCDCAYYPCRASGMGRSLDHDAVVHERPKIVGCEVSRDIFKEIYPEKDCDFINTCPLRAMTPEGPFITRCCRSERKGLVERNGYLGMVVHWGDGPHEISEAVRCLVNALKE